MPTRRTELFLVCSLFTSLLSCIDEPDATALRAEALGNLAPLPTVDPDLPAPRVELGRALYFEKALSRSGTLSCNGCHDLARHGVDGEATSPGFASERGGRNSPTTFNAFLHVAQFWDGRAATVEEQATGPILNPVEMGMPDAATVEATLAASPKYPGLFAAAFPDDAAPLTLANVGRAIGAFERTLLTPAPIDDFLRGDDEALDAAELRGLGLFLELGCDGCHDGAALGGGQFRPLLGRMTPDAGRFAVTGDERDRGVFKVPGLRNVAETGPYLHDGSIATLAEAVDLMVEHHAERRPLEADARADLLAFLAALSGPVDEFAAAQ
ncbi:cytochrome-c peroxidase [Nannocystis sp. RBIL2]|uniref:cytochrome-c peroxidase n=1 Tax=Nannocystis sp. RBIL2 TaxID=2996788 RepID=UPI002271141D|nr:cytochrome c peroxidase [Nannocystis sp. RBIL2]MCY1071527.1 cytochrome-c peroxidase [Nannocystis sp. RBIL2]